MPAKKLLSKGKRQFTGLSFQQRLPLLICILLLSIMLIFGCFSYIEVKNAALKTAKDRLSSLTQQFSNLFTQSSQVFITGTKTWAATDPMRKMFTTQPNSDSALLAIQKWQQQDSTSVLIELVSLELTPILRSETSSLRAGKELDALIPGLHFDPLTGSISKLYRIANGMYYAVAVPVIENKKTVGYLLRWRHLVATAQTIDQLSQLMGTKASLYIGNLDGSLWTDMIQPLQHPPVDTVQFAAPFAYTNASGESALASVKKIASTPWLVSVEFSRNLVVEPANLFLKWMILIGGVLIIIGIVIASVMSRNVTQPLKQLTNAATSIASGDYTGIVGVGRRDEVGKLARSFNAMIAQLSVARDNLEKKISESEQMNEQLRNLTAHLQNIREEERIHIAREMHDELGQLLTSFKMDVSWLNRNLPSNDKPAIKDKLTSMNTLVDESVSFVRKLAAELRPSILDDFGLIPALHWHSKEFQKRFSIAVDFDTPLEKLELAGPVATGLFRIYQESLTNVARHAEAQKVEGRLSVNVGTLTLSIKDDGKGFNYTSNSKKSTLGLLGMDERATMIGGKLDIQSSPGHGTTIRITVPLNGEVSN